LVKATSVSVATLKVTVTEIHDHHIFVERKGRRFSILYRDLGCKISDLEVGEQFLPIHRRTANKVLAREKRSK